MNRLGAKLTRTTALLLIMAVLLPTRAYAGNISIPYQLSIAGQPQTTPQPKAPSQPWLSGITNFMAFIVGGSTPPPPTPTPNPTSTPTPPPNNTPVTFRINAPYIPGTIDNIGVNYFGKTAVTWFGQVSPITDYADIRVGYSDEGLYVYLSAFDKAIWYNPQPTLATLSQWDGATLYIDTSGVSATHPGSSAYQFTSALSWFEPRAGYQTASQGNSGGWSPSAASFTTIPGYQGKFNDNTYDNRGWVMTFEIPFKSIGINSLPPQGTLWSFGMVMHNRDSKDGPPQPDEFWPTALNSDQPATWGQFHFGLPSFTPPSGSPTGSATIRRATQKSADVPDAAVGGTGPNLCPGDLNFIWNLWGNTNYGSDGDFNIMNQSAIADWPCFSKYYVTFPLTSVPANVKILSASVVLHQQGQAGDPGQSQPSWIQVMTVGQDWNEQTITWNNAPQPMENIGGTLADEVIGCGTTIAWPCVPRTFDVSYAAAIAYASGQPLRLVFYESDNGQHSGKYFTSSDTGDWNAAGRPALTVNWTTP